MKTEVSLINDFVAGALAGIGGLIAGHPLDTVKVHLQVHMSKGGTIQAFKDISRHGMFRGFFRGLSFPVTTQAASNSIFFGIYGSTLALITAAGDQSSSTSSSSSSSEGGGGGGGGAPTCRHVFLAGCSGGLVQVLVTCPTDLIKVVLQSQLHVESTHHSSKTFPRTEATSVGHVTPHGNATPSGNRLRRMEQFFRGPMEASVWVYRRHGLLGFYRGCSALLLRDPVTYGLYMVAYEVMYRRLMRSSYTDTDGTVASLVAGGFAGVTSWAICMPCDVIKSHIQSDVDRKRYSGTIDCAVKVFRRWGLRGFFAGLPVVCIRAFPTCAITFLVYSKTLKYLNQLTTSTK